MEIGQASAESKIALHACTVGYDHVHCVVGRHEKTIEEVVHHFKSRATKQMNRVGMHPLRAFPEKRGLSPRPWAEKCWHVFINDERQLNAAIDYVNCHPEKEGLPPQQWSFISAI